VSAHDHGRTAGVAPPPQDVPDRVKLHRLPTGGDQASLELNRSLPFFESW